MLVHVRHSTGERLMLLTKVKIVIFIFIFSTRFTEASLKELFVLYISFTFALILTLMKLESGVKGKFKVTQESTVQDLFFLETRFREGFSSGGILRDIFRLNW